MDKGSLNRKQETNPTRLDPDDQRNRKGKEGKKARKGTKAAAKAWVGKITGMRLFRDFADC